MRRIRHIGDEMLLLIKNLVSEFCVPLLFLLAVLLAIAGCVERPVEIDQPQWKTVRLEEFGFSIEYPTKWNVYTYDEAGKRGSRNIRLEISQYRRINSFGVNSVSGVWIYIEQKPQIHATLADVVQWGNEKIDQSLSQSGIQYPLGYEETLYQEEKLNSFDAARKRYTTFGSANFITEEIYFPREQEMIIIQLQVSQELFDDIYPDFQKVVNSFKTIEKID